MRAILLKIGSSARAILPASIREKLHLNDGDSVEIDVQSSQMVIKPCKVKTRYKLSELVAQCDEKAPYPDELRDWDNTPAIGHEAI